jgi:prepilin peptidase CpaA
MPAMPATDIMPDWHALILLGAALAAAAVIDLKMGRIPNFITLPAIVAGLVIQSALGGTAGLWQGLGGLAAGAIPMIVCWKIGGIGGGDVKLMAAIGALTNWQFAVATLVWGLAIAALMAIGVMIRRRIIRRTLRRVGLSLMTAVVPGVKKQWPDDTDSPKLPFALAICLGACASVADAWLGGPISRGLLSI